MTRKEQIFKLENLSIGYRGPKRTPQYVARGVEASLYSGELTAILGANGIGKSTLIRTMTKAQTALEGDVILKGQSIKSYSSKELASLVSVVLTERLDLRNTRVFDLVGMGRSPYTGFWGSLQSADVAIVEQSLDLVCISKLKDRMVDTLSDGERQKVMIAKALAQQTPIIILDEPTAFLDYPSKVETMQLLHRLARELKKTILLSTHDLELALQIADKIWLLDDTRELHFGVPEDLAIDGTLSRFFQRKGLSFDSERGGFNIEYSSSAQARVEGGGFRYNMVCKALMRCGIAVGGEDTLLVVRVSDHGIEVQYGAKPSQSVSTIEQLLEAIQI